METTKLNIKSIDKIIDKIIHNFIDTYIIELFTILIMT